MAPPISDVDFNLPIQFNNKTPISKFVGPQLPYPILGTSIFYNDVAAKVFSDCKPVAQLQQGNSCQFISAVDQQVSAVRAMWADVNAALPAVILNDEDVKNCGPVADWTVQCQSVRHLVNMQAGSTCNMQDYPWNSKPVDLGCFPHVPVTDLNMPLFRLTAQPKNGDVMILLAFHVMFRTGSVSAVGQWQQATFWWQAKPADSTLGQECSQGDPCFALGVPWQHFAMKPAIIPSDANTPIPSAYNPYIEASTTDESTISCIVCHTFASYPTRLQGQQPTIPAHGFSNASLDRAKTNYLNTYHATPTAGLWSMAFAIEKAAPASQNSTPTNANVHMH